MVRVYPSRDGLPLPPSELDLQPSRLKDRPENRSLHHHNWPAKRMGRLLISQTLRDLEYEQTFMPNDQHNLGAYALHTLYEPPEPASLIQMMDRLDIARETGEMMRIKVNGKWVLNHISDIRWKQIDTEYSREVG